MCEGKLLLDSNRETHTARNYDEVHQINLTADASDVTEPIRDGVSITLSIQIA